MIQKIEITADEKTIQSLHGILKEYVVYLDSTLFGEKYPRHETEILSAINGIEPVIIQIAEHCARNGIALPVREPAAKAAEHYDGVLGDIPF